MKRNLKSFFYPIWLTLILGLSTGCASHSESDSAVSGQPVSLEISNSVSLSLSPRTDMIRLPDIVCGYSFGEMRPLTIDSTNLTVVSIPRDSNVLLVFDDSCRNGYSLAKVDNDAVHLGVTIGAAGKIYAAMVQASKASTITLISSGKAKNLAIQVS